MPTRVAFRVEYDGTDFHGWQAQPDGRPTIQQSLERAIADVVGVPVQVDGASRTDAGVHARDQLAAVTYAHRIPPAGLVKAVNRRLPASIAVREGREVASDFAPRFASAGKTYLYRLYLGHVRRPLIDRFAWRVPHRLDLDRLAAGAAHLIGTHDFTSFAASDGSHRSAERTLWAITPTAAADAVVEIRVAGSAFLKQMVRNIVGTLVDVARGHRAPDEIAAILAARDRSCAGPTAPARGLLLEQMHLEAEAALRSSR